MLGQPSSGKSASTARRGVARPESLKGVLVVSSTPFEDSGRATLAAPTRVARISSPMRVKSFSKEVEILTNADGVSGYGVGHGRRRSGDGGAYAGSFPREHSPSV